MESQEKIMYVTTGIVMRRASFLPNGKVVGTKKSTLDPETTDAAFTAARTSYRLGYRKPPVLGGCTSPIREKLVYVAPNGMEHDIMYLTESNDRINSIKSLLSGIQA